MLRFSSLSRRMRLMAGSASLVGGLLLTQSIVDAAMVVDLRFADGTKSKPAVANQVETIQIWARLTGVTDINDSVNGEGIRLLRGNIRTVQLGGGGMGAFAGGTGFGVTNVTRTVPTSSANSSFTVGTSTVGGLARSNRNQITVDTLQDWGGIVDSVTQTAATFYDPATANGYSNGNSALSIGSGIINVGGTFGQTGNHFTGTRYFPATGFVPATQEDVEMNPALSANYGLTTNLTVGFTNSTGNAHYLDSMGNVLPSAPTVPTAGGVEFLVGLITFNGGALNVGAGLSTQLVWSNLNSFAFTIDGNNASPGGYISDPVLNTITFTGPAGPSNPVLSVTGSPITINVLQGGNVTVPGLTVTETAGAAANNITGTAGGGVATLVQAGSVPNLAANGTSPASLTLTPTGSATAGTFVGTVAYAADSFVANAGSTANVTLNVGNAAFDPTNSSTTFGPALIANVASGATVTNLSSNSNNAGTGTGGGPAALGTIATILTYNNANGTGPSTETVSMQWRTRNAAEANPINPKALLSDVLRLTGMNSAPGTDTGTFVLQMTYDLAYAGLNENAIAASGELQLAWLNGSGQWVNAVAGNIGGTPQFAGISPVQPGAALGTWGVDPSTDTVWAVLNHNSDFAVIPEPSTMVMGALTALGLGFVGLRRRRSKNA